MERLDMRPFFPRTHRSNGGNEIALRRERRTMNWWSPFRSPVGWLAQPTLHEGLDSPPGRPSGRSLPRLLQGPLRSTCRKCLHHNALRHRCDSSCQMSPVGSSPLPTLWRPYHATQRATKQPPLIPGSAGIPVRNPPPKQSGGSRAAWLRARPAPPLHGARAPHLRKLRQICRAPGIPPQTGGIRA